MKKSVWAGKLTLITGGSSGIGLALAKKLAAAGAQVHLLARRLDQLESAKAEVEVVRADPGQTVGILAGNVAEAEAITERLHEFEQTVGTPDLLINSAGITHPAEFQDTDLDTFRRLMEVNYLGTVHVTRAFIKGMLARGSGQIINISSAAGFVGTYGYTAYSGSKFAVRGFTDALRAEVKPRGLKVSIVFPPDTDTPQLAWETPLKPAVTREFSKAAQVLSADKVAEIILRAAGRGQYIIVPGFDTHLFYHLNNFLGPLAFKVIDLMVADAIKKAKK